MMLKFLTVDWVNYVFNNLSLKIYEKEQEKRRIKKQQEKRRIINNNRIIVKVNDHTIYDSKKQKNMPDGLYFALVSYGLKDSVNANVRNKKAPINYNIISSASTIPVISDNITTIEA